MEKSFQGFSPACQAPCVFSERAAGYGSKLSQIQSISEENGSLTGSFSELFADFDTDNGNAEHLTNEETTASITRASTIDAVPHLTPAPSSYPSFVRPSNDPPIGLTTYPDLC